MMFANELILDKKTLLKPRFIENVSCVCSKCYKVIPGNVVEINGKVFLIKDCCEKEINLLENDANFYEAVYKPYKTENHAILMGDSRYDKKSIEAIKNSSSHFYFPLTFKCNMSCPICYNKYEPHYKSICSYNPSLDSISSMLVGHRGKHINLIGGEPTMREDLPQIIKLVAKSGNLPDLHTNGLKFLDKRYIRKLKESGLKNITLSFDGFDENAYIVFRNQKMLSKKMRILKNLKEEGMKVWLSAVIHKNLNAPEIFKLIKFTSLVKGLIRGINFMTFYHETENLKERFTCSDVYKMIEKTTGIKVEQYIEERRFNYNIFYLFGKLSGKKVENRFKFLMKNRGITLKITRNGVKPAFGLEYLKSLNKVLEEAMSFKNRRKMILHLIKNMKVFINGDLMKMSSLFLFGGLDFTKGSRMMSLYTNYITIKVCGVTNTRNEDLGKAAEANCFDSEMPIVNLTDVI